MHGQDLHGSRKLDRGLQMSSDVAVKINGLGKYYHIYDKPLDRLKQALYRGKKQYYEEFKALDNISFEIKKGETLGVIGCNGSGKSTLLQIICGTLSPTSGVVEVNGRVAALLELGAGFNMEFTGRENIYMYASIFGLSTQEISARFDDIVAFADIGDFIDKAVKSYSSGMYVRLAFAVIVHVDADILVIDEAFAVGDVFFIQKCMRFLRSFQEKGTIIFVSHDSGAVVNLCDRAVWLHDGQVQQIGAAKNVCESYLAGSYGVSQSMVLPTESAVDTKQERKEYKDMRMDFINSSSLRNDIQVFRFSDTVESFGSRGAKIIDARLTDENLIPLSWSVGGESVCVVVEILALKPIQSVIVGFFIKDRLGQVLFGDNTHLDYCLEPISMMPSERITATFSFDMPILPQGNYSADVAVADGVKEDHEQLEWIHDAFVLESQASSTSTGLVGVFMTKIDIRKSNDDMRENN